MGPKPQNRRTHHGREIRVSSSVTEVKEEMTGVDSGRSLGHESLYLMALMGKVVGCRPNIP